MCTEGSERTAGPADDARHRRPGRPAFVSAVVVSLGILLTLAAAPVAAQVATPRTAIAVRVEPARTQRVERLLQTIGESVSMEKVDVTTQRAGIIRKLLFHEGEDVARGAPLLEMDSRVEQSDLRSAAAKRELARQTLERTRELTQRALRPLAEQQRDVAALVAAEADYQSAAVALDILTVRAPFAGTITNRLVSAGAFLSPGQTVATLQNLDQVQIHFRLPQRQYDRVRVGQLMRVTAQLGNSREIETQVSRLSPVLNADTHFARAEAIIGGARDLLEPGSFVRVAVVLSVAEKAVTVPAAAVVQSLTGDYVYTVEGTRARRLSVQIGERRDGFAEIVKGLAADQPVVVEGQFKLEDGSTVQVVPGT